MSEREGGSGGCVWGWVVLLLLAISKWSLCVGVLLTCVWVIKVPVLHLFIISIESMGMEREREF